VLVLTLPPGRAQSAISFRPLEYESITGAISSLALDGGATEIEMGDVNGDGCPDLVSVGDHGSPFVNTQQHGITVWLGNCQGDWTLVQTGNFGYGGIALGDVNWDGLMDVAYGVHHNYSGVDLGDQILEVALGDGSGASWTAWDDGLATNGEDWGMFGTDLGDVDADGDLDLASNSFGCCAGVHVYLDQGNGTWVQSFGFLGGNSDMDCLFADCNGDGQLDVGAGNSVGRVFLGDGTGGFTAASGNLPASYTGISAGDIDGDGRDELAVVVGGKAQVWSWGPGNVWTSRTGNLGAVHASAQRTELWDMDVDGRVDLLAFGNGTFGVWKTDRLGFWWNAFLGSTTGNGSKPGEFLRTGTDLDHNGFPDISIVQDETIGTFSSRNRHLVYAHTAPVRRLWIRSVAPTAGRTWRGGQVRFCDWTCAVPVGTALGSVAIELSTSGPAGPWTTLATGLTNNGRAQIVVPAGIASRSCVLRTSVQAPGASDQVIGPAFVILP
jgi:hypothetical protein